jgi:hypothetical protein
VRPPIRVPELGETTAPAAVTSALLAELLLLVRRARRAGDAELYFIAANETRRLAPYRQAAVWLADQGIVALSGVVEPEANAPYAQWLDRVFKEMQRRPASADFAELTLTATDLPPELAAEWGDWLPRQALWLPLPGLDGAWLLARDDPWSAEQQGLLAEWAEAWSASWALKHKPTAWKALRQTLLDFRQWRPLPTLRRWRDLIHDGQWQALWRQRGIRVLLIVLAVCLFPVRLSVLAPGELVPAAPAVIRAPMDGIIDKVLVQPNQSVKAGEVLFAFDRVTLASRLAVATQALATAEAEYRQAAQQALFDTKSKAQLALVQGKLAERQAEAAYLGELDHRTGVTSPRDGIVMFGDASEWIGRPVNTGERVMVVAGETDAEVEAWLSPGDMIELSPGTTVTLYLDASPFAPVSARLRHVAHAAQERPDRSFAYRLRARIEAGETPRRVGLKGTVKVAGEHVPLLYWVLRKPWAALRQFAGL